MRKYTIPSLAVAFAMGALASNLIQPVTAQSVFQAPEYVIEDQNNAVLGGTSDIAFKGQILVSMTNVADNERYWVQVGSNVLPAATLFSEQLDVWYSGAGCTGTAYIKEPAGAGVEAQLRGATYAIGRKAGATWEDSLVLRGTGTGTDNSASMSSKFKTTTAPYCTESQSTTVPTVVATPVADLSNFVRPFRYDK